MAKDNSGLPKVHKEDNTNNMNQSQPSVPPETPTPPPGTIMTRPHAPEPVTLPERHQFVRHIHAIESQNARLYDDNCRLVNTVNMLNERLVFLGAPQNMQVLRLANMQERLHASEANRSMIHQKYQDLLQCTSAGSAHRHISEELKVVREAYASLDKDHRLLGDKYLRLKAVVDVNRVAQNQSQIAVRGQFRAHDQSWNSNTPPVSGTFPGSFQPFLDQKVNQRCSSESLGTQLRPGPTPVATTWLAPLPSPPPSAPPPAGQSSPTGFPVHTSVPVGSLPLPHHLHDPRSLSGLPSMTQSKHLVQQASEQRNASDEIMDTAKNQPVPCGEQMPAPTLLKSSPRTLKRPNPEFESSTNQEAELKKPRIKGEVDHLMASNVDTCPTREKLSPPASADPHNDRKLPVTDSDGRPYQDCVNLIFEKDADVENGIFCGLCFDRHEAKMIPDPPDVLIQPDLDFLVRHCMDTHPAVWEDLRRKT